MKTEIKNYIMNKYLTITDTEDRIYSVADSPLEKDSEYSIGQRLRNIVSRGPSILREKKVRSDENQVNDALNKNQGAINKHAEKSKQKLTDNETAAINNSAGQVAHDSDEKNKHASHKKIIKRATAQAEQATGIKNKQSRKNVAINRANRNKWAAGQVAAQRAKHQGKATVGGAVVGGALGVGAGHIASTSARKELAALTAKGINSFEDRERADKLRKKIHNAKLAGGVIGSVGGLLVGRKINNNISDKKSAANIKYNIRNGSANYKKEKTLNRSKYM